MLKFTPKIFSSYNVGAGKSVDGIPAVWLDGCCPLFSRLLSRLRWRGWQGVVAVLSAHGGPMLIDLHSLFYALKPCRGRCLTTNVKQKLIMFFSEKCKYLNCECLSSWELR